MREKLRKKIADFKYPEGMEHLRGDSIWVIANDLGNSTLEGRRIVVRFFNNLLQQGKLTRVILEEDYKQIDWTKADPFEEYDNYDGSLFEL